MMLWRQSSSPAQWVSIFDVEEWMYFNITVYVNFTHRALHFIRLYIHVSLWCEVWFMSSSGLVTLNDMKAKQEALVKEREKQLAKKEQSKELQLWASFLLYTFSLQTLHESTFIFAALVRINKFMLHFLGAEMPYRLLEMLLHEKMSPKFKKNRAPTHNDLFVDCFLNEWIN